MEGLENEDAGAGVLELELDTIAGDLGCSPAITYCPQVYSGASPLVLWLSHFAASCRRSVEELVVDVGGSLTKYRGRAKDRRMCSYRPRIYQTPLMDTIPFNPILKTGERTYSVNFRGS
jgi:hypothetical protein